MAGEYLQRTPTSTGNRRVWTWSGWVKFEKDKADAYIWHCTTDTANHGFITYRNGNITFAFNVSSTTYLNVSTISKVRDFSSWTNLIVVLDTTQTSSRNRYGIYINGIYQPLTITTEPTINISSNFNTTAPHFLGVYGSGISSTYSTEANLADVFLIDGQALTPDVFGFYKQGKGYISAGSTQATDFRPGQWVPKSPRVIKTEINRRGGFGVNGFYLPMNDSRNFGADFHGDPNSIITLNEKLPQPRVGVATTASVGLGYTDALRADPYAANLVLALPFVSSGLTTGTDYAPYIKGSGTAKTITNNGVSIASTASHYGSAAFFNGSTQYLSIADSDDFNFGSGNFTIECWINPSTTVNTTSYRRILSQQQLVGGGNWIFRLDNQGVFQTNFYDGSNSVTLTTGARIDTLGQWTHIAVVRNGNTLANYINGVCAGIATNMSITIPDISATIEVGRYVGGSEYYVGYIQDLRVYKGVAKYTGGFDVPRPYTPVGIATWRAVPDTTANNFATLNPLSSPADSGLTNGNLDYTGPTGWRVKRGTIQIPTTGKWYFEARLKGSGANNTYNGSYAAVGVCTDLAPVDGTSGISTTSNLMLTDTGIVKNFTTTALSFSDNTVNTGSALSSGDIISIQIDRDANTYNFLKNGVSINSGTMNITANIPLNVIYISYSNSNGQMTMNFGQNPTFSGNTTAGTFTDSNGKGLFKYQPPTGFLALCEDNLPTPAISDPGKYFKTVLWTGDGAPRSIVGVGFTTDFVWIKGRTQVSNSFLFDSIRGATNRICSSLTNAEASEPTTLTSFSSDGFSLGTDAGVGACNISGQTYVAWCWRAGAGTTSTNTDGSITSVVSVNRDAGFSIVSYTGNGTAGATIGHGLGKAPKFILIKRRSGASNWAVAGSILGSASTLYLNLTNQLETYDIPLIGNIQTSTTFQVGTDTNRNASGGTHIAYCWAEIEGFSKFGTYVGNGSADGPFVYTGGRPAFVMIKRADSADHWAIFDSSRDSTNNDNNLILYANLTNGDSGDAMGVDKLSNGFKIRNTTVGRYNASGGIYIFACWMESPFTTANAK